MYSIELVDYLIFKRLIFLIQSNEATLLIIPNPIIFFAFI